MAIDDKMNRVNVFKELTVIFNNEDMVFDNFFVEHPHGDEELASLDPNDFLERPESTLKREYMNNSAHCINGSQVCTFQFLI